MTGSKVMIVKLPVLQTDVKALEAFRAYVCDALGAGALVLPGGTTYAVEDFSALGAVEVGAGNAVPVVIGGSRPTPAGGGGGLVVGGRVVRSVPDSGTAPEPERAESPAETPKQPNAPDKPAPILRSPPARSAAPEPRTVTVEELRALLEDACKGGLGECAVLVEGTAFADLWLDVHSTLRIYESGERTVELKGTAKSA